MSRKSEIRRSKTTSSAHGFDCVSFMELASPHRWREVEDFFPEDAEAVLEKEREVRMLPHQDASIHLFGSCGVRPDEVVMFEEDAHARIDRIKGVKSVSAHVDALLLRLLQKDAAKIDARAKSRLEAQEANRRLPDTDKMVPLEGEIVNPGPDYVKEVKKEHAKLRTIAEVQELDRIAALERQAKEAHERSIKAQQALALIQTKAAVAEARRIEQISRCRSERAEAAKGNVLMREWDAAIEEHRAAVKAERKARRKQLKAANAEQEHEASVLAERAALAKQLEAAKAEKPVRFNCHTCGCVILTGRYWGDIYICDQCFYEAMDRKTDGW